MRIVSRLHKFVNAVVVKSDYKELGSLGVRTFNAFSFSVRMKNVMFVFYVNARQSRVASVLLTLP